METQTIVIELNDTPANAVKKLQAAANKISMVRDPKTVIKGSAMIYHAYPAEVEKSLTAARLATAGLSVLAMSVLAVSFVVAMTVGAG